MAYMKALLYFMFYASIILVLGPFCSTPDDDELQQLKPDEVTHT